MKTTGENLKKARTAKNISQKKLAENLGVSQKTISTWEKGEQNIKDNMLKKICEILNCQADQLLGLKKSNLPSDNKKINTAFNKLINLQKKAQQSIFEHIDALSKNHTPT